jgi:hypothetical protein
MPAFIKSEYREVDAEASKTVRDIYLLTLKI